MLNINTSNHTGAVICGTASPALVKEFFFDLMQNTILYWQFKDNENDRYSLYNKVKHHWESLEEFGNHIRITTFGENYTGVIHIATYVHSAMKDQSFLIEEGLRGKIKIALGSFQNIGIEACNFDFAMR